ncbi:MAG: hypothetical protein HY519_02315 [Candidatus Aenigmarchaeota archaeon]|nr:hypothetical protein [Candidatus Aenigmarchaeota archaeon]
MKFATVTEKENQLMGRRELWLSIEHKGQATPTRKQLLDGVAKAVGSPAENVIIDRIFTDTGRSSSRLKVLAYKDKNSIPKAKLEKMNPELKQPAKPAEAQPAEEKK